MYLNPKTHRRLANLPHNEESESQEWAGFTPDEDLQHVYTEYQRNSDHEEILIKTPRHFLENSEATRDESAEASVNAQGVVRYANDSRRYSNTEHCIGAC